MIRTGQFGSRCIGGPCHCWGSHEGLIDSHPERQYHSVCGGAFLKARSLKSYKGWLGLLAAFSTLLSACGGGSSEQELEAVQRDLQAAQAQVLSLQAEKKELQSTVIVGELEELGELLSISEMMAFPPTVVELKPNSAAIQMITKVPTTCSIVHGLTARYGDISTDEGMMSGGHTHHNHVLRGLQPDTLYHYKWGLFGPEGTLYGSEDFTFKTPPP